MHFKTNPRRPYHKRVGLVEANPQLELVSELAKNQKNAWKVEEKLRHALNISMVAASAPGSFTNLGAPERWNMLSHRYS